MQITLEICVLISIRYMIRANGALFEYENYCNLEFAIKSIMNGSKMGINHYRICIINQSGSNLIRRIMRINLFNLSIN